MDLKRSWDWEKDIVELSVLKTLQPKTHLIPPILSRGALYQGASDDTNIYLWGGTTSYTNTSFPGFELPSPAKQSLWAYNTILGDWNVFDVSRGSPNRPSSAASAEAPDQGLAFFLNSQIDSGSSSETQNLGDEGKVFLEGMIVLDLKHRTARNVSTSALSGEKPRSRGRMQYIPGIGEKGILVHLGGNQKNVSDTTNSYLGDLVGTKANCSYRQECRADASTVVDGRYRYSGHRVVIQRKDPKWCLVQADSNRRCPSWPSRCLYCPGIRAG